MNKAYRLIKNRYTGVVQVTPETAKAHGKGKSMVKAGTLAAVLACASPLAWAADPYWSNAGTGNWNTNTNWNPTVVPTMDDTAYIDNGGTAQVLAAGTAYSLRIGDSSTGNLEIGSGGTLSIDWNAFLGYQSGSSGTAIVDGAGSNWTANSLGVGAAGTGTLTIRNSGSVSLLYTIGIGDFASGTGTATVTGSGSSLTSGAEVHVGWFGTGTLNIEDGGIVNIGGGNKLWLAALDGSNSGTLNIGNGAAAGILNAAEVSGGSGSGGARINFNHTDGAYYFTSNGASGGTAINITGSTAVNHNGSGTTILNGANTYTGTTTVNAGTLTLAGGAAIADTGAVVVNGGGTLNLAASETIGSLAGAGSVAVNANTLTTGGNNASTTYSGAMSGTGSFDSATGSDRVLTKTGTGTFTLTGTSALTGDIAVDGGGLSIASSGTLSNTGNLFLGLFNTGALNISGGGVVNSSVGWLAVANGTSGTATVDGPGSIWTNSSNLLVGDAGTGTLTITNGGAVSNTNGTIGSSFTSGSSTVTVDGAGSTWTNSATLRVGSSGSGTLTISGGGVVNASGTVTLANSGISSGTLNIGDGAAAGILNATAVNGGSGSGGARLNFNHTDGGYYFTHNGTAGGTAINITGSTAVNHNGSGTTFLTGTNTYTGGTTVDAGTLRRSVAGAFVSNTAYTVNGGTLHLNNLGLTMSSLSGSGGTVNIGTATLTVNQSGNTGYAGTISGTTGTLINLGTGTLTLTGTSATDYTRVNGGTLGIAGGGTLSNVNGYLGYDAADSGTVTVDGAGSSWTNSAGLFVGYEGSSTLNITDGGTVSNTNGNIGYFGGSSTVTVDGSGSTWTNSAPLQVGYMGSGTLNISNAGLVNVATGTATLASQLLSTGTLNIGTGGVAGVLNATTVNGGSGTATLNFNHTDGAYYFTSNGASGGTAINITGSTAVNHNGSGTTYLTGTNTYTGATTVSAGTLAVNGSLTNSTVTVNSGGTLGGSGSISGAVTVNSGGTLAPGNSPGLLTVGSLTLDAGSTTVMEIDGTTRGTQYDAIDVTGTATLGGTLSLVFGYTPTVGDSYTLIDAAAISGNFATITTTGLGAALKVVPTITDDYVMTVDFSQGSFVAAAGGAGALTGNQSGIAANLDTFSTSGQAADLIAALNTLSAGALPPAFDALSGAEHAHGTQVTALAGRRFHGVLGERIGKVGAGETAGSSGSAAFDGLSGMAAGDVPAQDGFWLRALAGDGRIKSDGNTAGMRHASVGLALGADRRIDANRLAGVALAYGTSRANSGSSKVDVTSFQLSAYGRWQNEAYYLDGSLGVGRHRTESRRDIAFLNQQARADYDTDSLTLNLEAGRPIARGPATLTPYAGIEGTMLRREGFAETGSAANLSVAGDTETRWRSRLGARYQWSGARFQPTLDLAWVHAFGDAATRVDARFAAAPAASAFRVSGPELDRDRLALGLGLTAWTGKNARLDLAYNGEFARSDRDQQVAATFRWVW